MMRKLLFIITLTLSANNIYAQTAIISTNNIAEQIMLGNYAPTTYKASNVNGVESLFSEEKFATVNVNYYTKDAKTVELLQNHPKPFDGETTIAVATNEDVQHKSAYISIRDLNGKEIKRLNIALKKGVNQVYSHEYFATGMYLYSLVINGETKRMIFAN